MGPLARRRRAHRGREGASWGWESNLTLSQRNASLHERWVGSLAVGRGASPWGYSLGHACMRGVWGTSRRPKSQGALLRSVCCCGGGFRNDPLEQRGGAGVGGAPGSTPNAAGAMETAQGRWGGGAGGRVMGQLLCGLLFSM